MVLQTVRAKSPFLHASSRENVMLARLFERKRWFLCRRQQGAGGGRWPRRQVSAGASAGERVGRWARRQGLLRAKAAKPLSDNCTIFVQGVF